MTQLDLCEQSHNKIGNLSFTGGYYSTPRSCMVSGIGIILGAVGALIAAPAGVITSTLAMAGGGIIGGNAINLIMDIFGNKKQ